MKIAKKVLAVAMAVAMIACFAAVAFAAIAPETAQLELVLDTTGKKPAAMLYAKDCTGLASADLKLAFDPAVVKSVRALAGADAKLITAENFNSNTFTSEVNNADVANVQYAFYFKEFLWNAEKFADPEENLGEVEVNATNFHIAKFEITLQEGKTAEDIVVSFTASAKFTNGEKGADGKNIVEAVDALKCVGIEKKAEETTQAPTTEAPTTEAPTTEAPTTEEAPSTPNEETTAKGETDKGPATGDTGVLAIAAGVVALAGAAFVVSKKRK